VEAESYSRAFYRSLVAVTISLPGRPKLGWTEANSLADDIDLRQDKVVVHLNDLGPAPQMLAVKDTDPLSDTDLIFGQPNSPQRGLYALTLAGFRLGNPNRRLA